MYNPDAKAAPVLRLGDVEKTLPPGLTPAMVQAAITAGTRYLDRPDATDRGVIVVIWTALEALKPKAF